MFAVEIQFGDSQSETETIFVRRPQAVIGSTDNAHVVVDDMRDLDYQLRLIRQIGRTFQVRKTSLKDQASRGDLLGEHTNEATFKVGSVTLHVTALDSDILMREGETPDSAGVRVLRHVSNTKHLTKFPALIATGGGVPVVFSFREDQPILVGRAKQCELRLDASEVSAKHARIGFEGGSFWVEDLGSTNGTFVNRQQVSGRVNVPAQMPIILGRDVSILGVTNQDELLRGTRISGERIESPVVHLRQYPLITSLSEVARPAKLVLPMGQEIYIGRDPQCDVWLGAPHISRRHCSLHLDAGGDVTISDLSTNGTAYSGGILRRKEKLALDRKPEVLDFGGGVTVAICFTGDEEASYRASLGAPNVFGVREGTKLQRSQRRKGRFASPARATREVRSIRQDAFSLNEIFRALATASSERRVAFIIVIILIAMILALFMVILFHARF